MGIFAPPTDTRPASLRRGYVVMDSAHARGIADGYLASAGWPLPYRCGQPEIDDRIHCWRVPLFAPGGAGFGEVVVDANTGQVSAERSTSLDTMASRHAAGSEDDAPVADIRPIERSPLPNTILAGDAEETLAGLPGGSVDLVFSSPPYFNARPGCGEYGDYEEYLEKMGRVFAECARTLAEGRFLVVNTSPVLVRRDGRGQSSRRLAVPFDLHAVIAAQGFDFIDDIIWCKPEGAGWATGRGRRFAADRHPLQYKAVPVTEYVLVYRKHTTKLIDWNIRGHHDQRAVAASRIDGDYERTNIWRIPPTSTPDHPAVFPDELAARVVRYYSFQDDVVCDPFAGSGTVGRVCAALGRRFVLAEIRGDYVELIKRGAVEWLGKAAEDIRCVNTPQIWAGRLL